MVPHRLYGRERWPCGAPGNARCVRIHQKVVSSIGIGLSTRPSPDAAVTDYDKFFLPFLIGVEKWESAMN